MGYVNPPPPKFLLYLLSNCRQTWHDGTLEQKLSKALKILLTSSLRRTYDVIKQFSVIQAPLSFIQFGQNLAQGSKFLSADSEYELKIPTLLRFEEEKAIFHEGL